jgi:methionyl-tRNA formyltransferase
MKIVCLIGTPVYLNYFINEIAAHHNVALVIRENSHTDIGKKILKKGILNTARIVIRRLRNRKRLVNDYHDILENKWQAPSASIPLVNTPDINSDFVKQQLREIKPDLVLVHGTSLIKDDTLAGIPLALNLHWGLSPYYKGSYCTEWALINHDPANIGFTIHRISSRIDAGDILTQARVAIKPEDTANRINMRLTRQGTQALVTVIDRLVRHEQPVFREQDNTTGTLYLTKHWTTKKQREIAALENRVSMEKMLKNPAKKEYPIVTW